MKVVFAGTPEFARSALEQIAQAGLEISLVLTQPDRPAGRGLKLQPSAVKAWAQEHAIEVLQPRSLRLDGRYAEEAKSTQAKLTALAPDVMVVAAYGLLLPAWTLQLPRFGCLNIHASLLPRWRGAAPIHRAIEAGDTQTGITIMQMDEGLDTGAMLAVKETALLPTDTTATLHDRLAALGGALIVEQLQRLVQQGTLLGQPQPAVGVTYAHKIDKAEARLDWRLSARQLAQRIRAFDPFPGAHFMWQEAPIKVWQAHALVQAHTADPPAAPGTVLAVNAQGMVIACADGALQCILLQRPGGKRQAPKDWLQSLKIVPGTRLE